MSGSQDSLARRLSAYRKVFGLKGHRNEAQELVLRDIESRGRVWQNCWVPGEGMAMDPYRAALAEGQRIFAIATIQAANSLPQDEPGKPKVITNEHDREGENG